MSIAQLKWVLLLAVPLLFVLALASGPSILPLGSALSDIWRGNDSINAIILLELRLPRAVLAMLVGAMLALSGAALQGLLRNPLASPDILGVSQMAALAAVIVLYFGLASLAWFILPVAAIAGAGFAVLLMFSLNRHVTTPGTLILSGVAISAVAGSFIALALNFAPNPYAMQEIYYWLLGSVANRSQAELWLSLRFMLLGSVLIWSQRYFLDALSLGEDTAQSLGFDIKKSSRLLIAGAACCIGACVAVSGNIGFVGLVVPHLLRPLVKAQPSQLVLWCLPGGAVLVMIADLAVQALPGAQELQLGVLTSALGGPFFLYLLFRNRQWFL